MATASVISEVQSVRGERMSLEDYLRTMFHPDRDYVDGVAEERVVGEWDHATLQFRLAALLMTKRSAWKIQVVGEARLQIRKGRFRIPDVMVLPAGEKVHRYPTTAPLLCVEILSPKDIWGRVQAVVNDYCELGVPGIWALDPETRGAYYCDRSGFRKTDVLAVEGTPIRLTADEIFALLDPVEDREGSTAS
jgi:Uma2 family endonuclease